MFSKYAGELNRLMSDDPDCAALIPIEVEDDSLHTAIKDGVLIAKLLLIADKEALDLNQIHKSTGGKTIPPVL